LQRVPFHWSIQMHPYFISNSIEYQITTKLTWQCILPN
jgi:hypothetical protein